MVPLEYINLGVSIFSLFAAMIYPYFNKKDFMERFQKYQQNIKIQVKQDIKSRIQEIDKGLKLDNLDRIESIINDLAKKLEDSKNPAREYFEAYKNLKMVYLLLAVSIITSLVSINNPSAKVFNITHAMWGFTFMIVAIAFIAHVIYSLYKVNEKVIAFELNISYDS